MTIGTEISKITAQGNGTADLFSFSPVVLHAESDMRVVIVRTDGSTEEPALGSGPSNFAVVVASYPGTGSVRYPASGATRLLAGEFIVMRRVVPITQPTDLENEGGYFAETQETALDRLTMIDQQQQEQLDRAVKVPIGDDQTAEEFADSILSVQADVAAAEQAATAAAASAASAAASADNAAASAAEAQSGIAGVTAQTGMVETAKNDTLIAKEQAEQAAADAAALYGDLQAVEDAANRASRDATLAVAAASRAEQAANDVQDATAAASAAAASATSAAASATTAVAHAAVATEAATDAAASAANLSEAAAIAQEHADRAVSQAAIAQAAARRAESGGSGGGTLDIVTIWAFT